MNREIKFRAWDKRKHFMIKIFDSTTQASWFLPEVSENFEIMQFAGFKDSKGNDIYEGDIVKLTNESGFTCPALVTFLDGCFDVVFEEPLLVRNHRDLSHYYKKRDYLKCFTCNHAAVVMGNIYENSELYKGELS